MFTRPSNLPRYAVENKRTGTVRRHADTRQQARNVKRSNERIWDHWNGKYIR